MSTEATGIYMVTSLPVSVVIPVRNEEKNLPGCLERLGPFAEVIVVDSGSIDATTTIAEKMGARVVPFVWNGHYPKKRNHILLNEPLVAPWVLFLDADEQVSPAFCDELACLLPESDKVGYWLTYTNHFMGRALRHGITQRKLSLFRVGRGLYERIEENAWSHLDMEIHEHPILDGETGKISTHIDHRDFRGLESFLNRHIDYAKWEAHRYQTLQSNASGSTTHLTSRQKFKYRNLERWWYPSFYFVATYIAKLGFLDGRAGFEYAFYKFWYFTAIRGFIAENRCIATASS